MQVLCQLVDQHPQEEVGEVNPRMPPQEPGAVEDHKDPAHKGHPQVVEARRSQQHEPLEVLWVGAPPGRRLVDQQGHTAQAVPHCL